MSGATQAARRNIYSGYFHIRVLHIKAIFRYCLERSYHIELEMFLLYLRIWTQSRHTDNPVCLQIFLLNFWHSTHYNISVLHSWQCWRREYSEDQDCQNKCSCWTWWYFVSLEWVVRADNKVLICDSLLAINKCSPTPVYNYLHHISW